MDITTEQVIMAENERPQIRAQLTMCGAAVTLALPEGASFGRISTPLETLLSPDPDVFESWTRIPDQGEN
jgi:hypothetical protein